MSDSAIPVTPVTANRILAHVVAGRVRELYQVPEVFLGLPVADLFPAEAEWVEIDGAEVGVGWTVVDGAFVAPPVPVPPPPPTTMSPLSFFARFRPEESAALYGAATQSPEILGFLLQASAAQTIDLTDPRLQVGLFALVGAGLLPTARATAILTP